MSIHLAGVSTEAICLHKVEAVSLGPVRHYPAQSGCEAFTCRHLVVAMAGGQELRIELYADEAGALEIQEQEGEA